MSSTVKRIRQVLLTAYAFSLLANAVVDLVNATEASAPRPGDLVFQTDFETSQQREAWSKARLRRVGDRLRGHDLVVHHGPDRSSAGR